MDVLYQQCALQYTWVTGARQVLFTFLGTLAPDDLVRELPAFGHGGSIRNLLVHTANVYEHWAGRIALQQATAYSRSEDFSDMPEIAGLYRHINALMNAFLNQEWQADENIVFLLNNRQRTATPFQIFSHMITHEFHHKGQLLSMSRQLGYIPVDTDMIRA